MFDFYFYGFNIGNIVFNALIALTIALCMGKLHEVIHYLVAKRFGYKINGFSLWKNETDVDIKEDDPNFKKIARAPYYVMFPVGILLTCLGVFLYPNELFLGVLVSGIAVILLHGISVWFEGKDVKQVSDMSKKEGGSMVGKE